MSMFFRRGKSGAFVVLTISNPAAPTVAEITAGVAIGKAVAGLTGFDTTLNRVNTAVMAYAQELQSTGPQTFGDASITCIEDDGSGSDADSTARVAAYTALAEGTTGYLVLSPRKAGVLAAADKVEVWPIQVGARNRDWGLGTDTARYTAALAITGAPNKDAVVAA